MSFLGAASPLATSASMLTGLAAAATLANADRNPNSVLLVERAWTTLLCVVGIEAGCSPWLQNRWSRQLCLSCVNEVLLVKEVDKGRLGSRFFPNGIFFSLYIFERSIY
jgi:hypothetical protein